MEHLKTQIPRTHAAHKMDQGLPECKITQKIHYYKLDTSSYSEQILTEGQWINSFQIILTNEDNISKENQNASTMVENLQ